MPDIDALLLKLQEAMIYDRPLPFANLLAKYCTATGLTLEAALNVITSTIAPPA